VDFIPYGTLSFRYSGCRYLSTEWWIVTRCQKALWSRWSTDFDNFIVDYSDTIPTQKLAPHYNVKIGSNYNSGVGSKLWVLQISITAWPQILGWHWSQPIIEFDIIPSFYITTAFSGASLDGSNSFSYSTPFNPPVETTSPKEPQSTSNSYRPTSTSLSNCISSQDPQKKPSFLSNKVLFEEALDIQRYSSLAYWWWNHWSHFSFWLWFMVEVN